jgi:glucose/arabinose dehydrogenase
LLGKILRLDVRATNTERPYAIPPDNPSIGEPVTRPEIWVTGLRNPWRFGFDRLTGDLFIGDVGSATFEEVNYQPGDSAGGENYGWPLKEGTDCRDEAAECADPTLVDPIAQYGRDLGSVVVGGGVYRGSALPVLVGTYLFADYGRGTIWGLGRDADGVWIRSAPVETGLTISSFGEDERGELYVVDLGGGLYRLTG